MKRIFDLDFCILMVSPSTFAQELNDDFISLGTINATIGGEQFQ